MPLLFLVLALITFGLHGLTVAILLQNGLHRSFPFFLVYNCFSILSYIIRWVVPKDYPGYFFVYWITEAVYALLALLMLIEVSRRMFRDSYINSRFRILLSSFGIVILVLALGAPIRRSLSFRSLADSILSVDLAVRLGFVSALVIFLGLIMFFNVRGKRYELGIVLGYSLFSAVYLIGLALRTELGTSWDWVVRYPLSIAYTCAVVIWLWTFLKKEPSLTSGDPAGNVSPEAASLLSQAYRNFTGRRWLD